MAVRIPGINIDEYYQQLGPIEPLIRDDRVTEIMVNGNDHVYVEMAGKVVLTNIKFVDEDQLLNVIQFIVRTVGRRIDERSPLCDARLADGSRVNAVIRPLALNGPLLTIRKFSRDPYQVDDLIRFGTANEAAFGFLKAAVLAKANIIVSGGTGTGKTTFLNVLSGFIPVEDRIVTIEDAAELQLHQEHVCRMETRPKDINGEGDPPAGGGRDQRLRPAQPAARRLAQGDSDHRGHGHGGRDHHHAGHLRARAEGRHGGWQSDSRVQADRSSAEDPRPHLRAGNP